VRAEVCGVRRSEMLQLSGLCALWLEHRG